MRGCGSLVAAAVFVAACWAAGVDGRGGRRGAGGCRGRGGGVADRAARDRGDLADGAADFAREDGGQRGGEDRHDQ